MRLILHWLGLDSANSSVYLFYSGLGGILLTWLGAGLVAWWALSCRRAWWCLLAGRHEWEDPETGVVHKLCWVHHPRVDGQYVSGGPLARLRAEHRLHAGRRTPAG